MSQTVWYNVVDSFKAPSGLSGGMRQANVPNVL